MLCNGRSREMVRWRYFEVNLERGPYPPSLQHPSQSHLGEEGEMVREKIVSHCNIRLLYCNLEPCSSLLLQYLLFIDLYQSLQCISSQRQHQWPSIPLKASTCLLKHRHPYCLTPIVFFFPLSVFLHLCINCCRQWGLPALGSAWSGEVLLWFRFCLQEEGLDLADELLWIITLLKSS